MPVMFSWVFTDEEDGGLVHSSRSTTSIHEYICHCVVISSIMKGIRWGCNRERYSEYVPWEWNVVDLHENISQVGYSEQVFLTPKVLRTIFSYHNGTGDEQFSIVLWDDFQTFKCYRSRGNKMRKVVYILDFFIIVYYSIHDNPLEVLRNYNWGNYILPACLQVECTRYQNFRKKLLKSMINCARKPCVCKMANVPLHYSRSLCGTNSEWERVINSGKKILIIFEFCSLGDNVINHRTVKYYLKRIFAFLAHWPLA